jgi:sulfur carrier protein ThiS adenylyltransferase
MLNKEIFISEAFKRLPKELINSINSKKVVIAGAGGLGSNIAVALVRSGISNLILIDFDKVEYSNLNRQYYFYKHIGMNKVDALEEQLKNINPFVTIEKHNVYLDENNYSEILLDCDIIVEAFDNAQNKENIVHFAIKNKKYIVSGIGMAGDYSANLIQTKKLGKYLYISGDFKNEANDENGLLASRVAITANHQANMVLRLLQDKYDV